MDKDVLELVSTMENALDYVDTVKTSEGLTKALEAYIEGVLRQIMECVIFIREYCQAGFASERGSFMSSETTG